MAFSTKQLHGVLTRARSRRRGYACSAALAVILVLGFGLRAHMARSPNAHQSSDEYSYVTIAQALAERGTYGGKSELPLRWPPGAPIFFAAAQRLDPSAVTHGAKPDIPSAYWAQALVGTGTIIVTFALVALLAGAIPALAAAGLVALYPPLVIATGDLLSEPLGAFLLVLGVLAIVWAARATDPRRYALAGVLVGLAILTRADYLLLPAGVIVLLVLALRQRSGTRRALICAASLAAAIAATIGPWTVYVSGRAHGLTPVTTGDAPALFVGTLLAGNGDAAGMKRALGAQARRFTQYHSLRHVANAKVPASVVLDMVAARHPGLPRAQSLRLEAFKNLAHDARHPLAWAGLIVRKVGRMWIAPTRIGSSSTASWVVWVHLLVLVAALAGLVLGIVRVRSWQLVLIAMVALYSTAVHALTVAQPRYNLPLMPLLIAGGMTGLALTLRAAREAAAHNGCGRIAIGEALCASD